MKTNTNKSNEESCLRLREELEPDARPSAEQEEHLAACGDCAAYMADTAAIVELARAMPQFDVSEELTQSILKATRQGRSKQSDTMAGAVVVLGFLFFLFSIETWETTWGILSWLIGLAAMVIFKYLAEEPARESAT